MAGTKTPQFEVNESYHYPPELLELLCDAVPCLFRSKQGVIDFFAGAGVPAKFLNDWKLKLSQSRDTVKKHEIVRSVLVRINEVGDAAIACRREIIKRIAQFEDFSSCWESERLKAQGLVGQIQKVVNVKDSFTRMNQERERERKEVQAQNAARLKVTQQRAENHAAIKASLYRLFAETNPYKRGKQLEGILNDLFAFAGILVKEAFIVKGDEKQGILEQIDGAVDLEGMVYLVEMKWHADPIGRAELAPHMVSVFNRGDVGGIFISYSGYSSPAIDEAKTGLAQKTFILTELQEIIEVVDREGDLKAYLKAKLNQARTHRNPFYKPFS
jgi:hypothetical protein